MSVVICLICESIFVTFMECVRCVMCRNSGYIKLRTLTVAQKNKAEDYESVSLAVRQGRTSLQLSLNLAKGLLTGLTKPTQQVPKAKGKARAQAKAGGPKAKAQATAQAAAEAQVP